MELNKDNFTYFIKFGGPDSCKLTQMAFDPYVFRKRQYINVDNWEMEVEQNYWKKAFQETPGYPVKTFHDFLFTTNELRISTLLQQKHVDGTVIDEALLRVFNQSEIPVLNIYFKNITINKIVREGKSRHRPLLTILFDYERIKMEYLNTPTGKGPAAKSEASWNLKDNNGYFDDPVYEEYKPATNNIPNMADLQLASVMAGVLNPKEKIEEEKQHINLMVIDHQTNAPFSDIKINIVDPKKLFDLDLITNNKGFTELTDLDQGNCTFHNKLNGQTINNTLRLVDVSNKLLTEPIEKTSDQKGTWNNILEIEAYKVKSGDSLRGIADNNNLTVDDLTHFNWQTTAPDEINNNLRDIVGCTEKTEGGKSYMFSESDDPGIIYIPKPLSLKLETNKTHVFRVEAVELSPLPNSARIAVDITETPDMQKSRDDKCILISSKDNGVNYLQEVSLEVEGKQLNRIEDNKMRVFFKDIIPDKKYSCYVDVGEVNGENGYRVCLFYNKLITQKNMYAKGSK